jgi:hypothetical protein
VNWICAQAAYQPTSTQPNPRALCSLVSIMTAAVNRRHALSQSICRRGRIGHSTRQHCLPSCLLNPPCSTADSQGRAGMDLRFVFFQSFQGQGRRTAQRSAAEPKGRQGRQGIAPQPAHTSTASETDKGQGCSKLPSVTVHGAACAPPSSNAAHAAHSADEVMLGCKKGPALAGMHAPSMTCAKAGRPVVCLAGCS